MTTTLDESGAYIQLRSKAEAQLEAGTTNTTGHWSMGVGALNLLHRLSSNPENANDALKLLHELQVHQVELDLQNEEITANERVLAEELRLYRTLYDYAPFAYFVVDLEGTVMEGNQAAAEFWGVGKDHLEGQPIDSFVNPQDQPVLLDLLQRVAKSGAPDYCVAGARGGVQDSRNLRFRASRSPGREQILMVCCERGNAE